MLNFNSFIQDMIVSLRKNQILDVFYLKIIQIILKVQMVFYFVIKLVNLKRLVKINLSYQMMVDVHDKYVSYCVSFTENFL